MSTDNKILSQKPSLQSHDEWLQSYDSARLYRQASNTPDNTSQRRSEPSQQDNTLTGSYQYIGHRTTKQGRVVLEFVHMDTGVVAVRFFNVDIKNYRPGECGQFTTRKKSKFRQFWRHAVSEQPRRWCRVHWEMHKLKEIKFKGLARHKNTATGGYWNIEKIRKQS